MAFRGLRRTGIAAAAAAVLAGVGFISNSLYTVEAGQRGIIFDRYSGIKPEVIPEGTHFLIPGLQNAIIMNVRTIPRSIQTETGTKDLQTVSIHLRVLYRPNVARLPELYQKLGPDFGERVLPSIGNEVCKAVVANYDAVELLTLRDQISVRIRDTLQSRAREFNIELDDISITDIAFSREFTKAIEDKQVAEQNAEKAKFMVQKAEQEREALVVRSEGDSEAARLVSEAFAESGKGLIELRRIETAQYIAEVLSHKGNITYLPGQHKSADGQSSSGGNAAYLLQLPAR